MNPVVIVETEDVVRDAVADVLRDAGIEVVALADGWDIFLLSEETVPPSLLVTNINLGVRLDGFKLAAAAQHRWPGLPVICISSHPVKYQPLDCDPCDWLRMELFTPTGFVEVVQRLIVTNRKGKSHAEAETGDSHRIDQRYRTGHRDGTGGVGSRRDAERFRRCDGNR